ncbi:MAG TPA: iron ABC transporter substrate-binding protein [Mycobacteriales bacterium]|nr:iron ABC transporter substrate-binding protein [Mycobacteriales bacterium]
MRRPLVSALVALSVVAGTAACVGPFAGGSDALTVYSGRNPNLVDPLLDMFTEDTGIEVERRYGGTAELAAQILEEGDGTRADVFFAQDAGALGALAKDGRLQPLSGELVGAVDQRYRARDSTWVGVSGRARVIVYNDRKVEAADVPESVFDLVKPEWRDRVGIAPTNASFQSFVTGMRILADEARTEGWLRGIKANAVQEYDSNVAVLDAVDRGEVDVGLINHYYWFEKAKEVGKESLHAQLHFLAGGDPGALVNVAGVGILKGTARGADAEELAAYLLGEKAQKYFRDVTFEYPIAAGVTPSEGLPALAEVAGPPIDLADLDTLDETLALLEKTGLT